jgi:metal-responsive CopG/Arc/MetJ family transcriptional regulator
MHIEENDSLIDFAMWGDHVNLISIRLPSEFVEILDEMVLQGKYASRSEAIRLALRDFYREHYASKQSTDFRFPNMEFAYKNVIFEDD